MAKILISIRALNENMLDLQHFSAFVFWNFGSNELKSYSDFLASQFGNFMVFLSLRFYVKSILKDLEVLKNDQFGQFLTLAKNHNSEPLNVLKSQIFHF